MLISDILKIGLEKAASDVILTAGHYPALKVNGDVVSLEEHGIINPELIKKELLSIMSERQKEAFLRDLEIDFSIDLQGYSRFRVNAFKQKDGYGVVFRPITDKIKTMDELGLPEQVQNFIGHKTGLVLVTGAVGSGKSTTLASMLNQINKTSSRHIITVEDPIEFVFKNEKSIIEQREVGASTLSFDNGLKYALRQAPDIIMVGEMRDLETFRLALRAAETGNLVFATLHTSGAARTVSRIIDMFPGDEKNQIRQQLSESLRGVIWQILLKNKEENGRVAAHEILVNNTEVANMIRKDATHQINNAIETGAENGMLTMKKSLESLYGRGLIGEETYETSLRQLTSEFML
ncbi:MAG: PilT/PilU family type 4a pilus ATPase [Candidatus Gracilibacteria bacterium]|nr:PilT/PilU family type 4a pilus ATPase [Candidatus Gracilibacteria bacterium]